MLAKANLTVEKNENNCACNRFTRRCKAVRRAWKRNGKTRAQLQGRRVPRFKEYVESSGLDFAPVNGDGDMMMRVLLSECKDGLAYLDGMKALYFDFIRHDTDAGDGWERSKNI